MAKKVYRNNKKKHGSTGKKIFIGLSLVALVGGVVALALHYSFENDKRVPAPSTSNSSSSTKSARRLSQQVVYPDLDITNLVDGREMDGVSKDSVNLSLESNVDHQILVITFDSIFNGNTHFDSNGTQLYHFDLEQGSFVDFLEQIDFNYSDYTFDIKIRTIEPANSEILYFNYLTGNFEQNNKCLSATFCANSYSGLKDGIEFQYTYSSESLVPSFWFKTTGNIESVYIAFGADSALPFSDKTISDYLDIYLDRINFGSENGFFVKHAYDRTLTYPSGVFSIGGEKELFIDYKTAPTLDEIVDQIKVADYSGAKLEVLSSDYDPESVGEYTVELKASDTAGNISTLTLKLKVFDYQPKLRAKSGNSTDITIGYSRLKNWDMITSLFEAYDYNKASLPIAIKNAGGLKFNKVGTYHPVLSATDSAGREVTLTLTVTITDDLPPVFIFSDNLCFTSKEKPLTIADLERTILLSNKLSSDQINSIDIYENTYTENSRKVGEYSIGYQIDMLSSEKRAGTLKVKVIADEINIEERTPWIKFWDNIDTAWTEFWIKLGNLIRLRGWTL